MPKKAVSIKPGDVVAVHWSDHCGFKSVPLVAGALKLMDLVTYGEVLSLSGANKTIELIQEKQLTEGGEANDACALGTGMVKKVVIYREAGTVEF